jgi:hypothetical protein
MSSHKDHKNELTLKELEDELELVQDITIPSEGSEECCFEWDLRSIPVAESRGVPLRILCIIHVVRGGDKL